MIPLVSLYAWCITEGNVSRYDFISVVLERAEHGQEPVSGC